MTEPTRKPLKELAESDAHIMVCSTDLSDWVVPSVETTCYECGVAVVVDEKNWPIVQAQGWITACLRCVLESGILLEVEEVRSMVLGQDLSFEEGMETVKAIINPAKEEQ